MKGLSGNAEMTGVSVGIHSPSKVQLTCLFRWPGVYIVQYAYLNRERCTDVFENDFLDYITWCRKGHNRATRLRA